MPIEELQVGFTSSGPGVNERAHQTIIEGLPDYIQALQWQLAMNFIQQNEKNREKNQQWIIL